MYDIENRLLRLGRIDVLIVACRAGDDRYGIVLPACEIAVSSDRSQIHRPIDILFLVNAAHGYHELVSVLIDCIERAALAGSIGGTGLAAYDGCEV